MDDKNILEQEGVSTETLENLTENKGDDENE